MRVAIVNDQLLAREVLRRLVTSVPGYSVAWQAQDGAEAVRRAAGDCPDAVLMDLIMPVMDGVEATRRIMTHSPCPILLVTSSVATNFNHVYAALGHGALDAVNTPTLGHGGVTVNGEALLDRLAKLAQAQRALLPPAPTIARPVPRAGVPPLVLLGASTGGPEALAQVLAALPANLSAPIVIAQHIAADFAPSLARWLAQRAALPVQLLHEGAHPEPGHALVAATNDHVVVHPDQRLGYSNESPHIPYRPSVDVLFTSAARHWPAPGVAVVLTGMGSDGAQGLLALRRLGWHTIAQDEPTSVVYGMPRCAAELKAACQILPLPQIAHAIVAAVQMGVKR